MLTIVQAVNEEQIQQVRALFTEYVEFIRTDVDTSVDNLDDVLPMAGYEQELAELPGKYTPPDGRLLLALYGGEAAGCVAFYKLGEGVCEVKRMWVRPQFRGKKIGRALVETLIAEARASGYATMLLSTVDILTEAQALYRSLGFELTEPFFELPDELMAHEVFMKLELGT